jgi:hypothetical protein
MEQWPTQAQCRKFYGAPGTGHTMLVLPFPMYLAWDHGVEIKRFTIHSKCAASALRVFNEIAKLYPSDQIRRDVGIAYFAGCYNNRPMRGGSQPSMHAYACAIDFDDGRNQLKFDKKQARLAKPDCEPFWQAWEKEGWVSLGRSRNFDWMHVQAARL